MSSSIETDDHKNAGPSASRTIGTNGTGKSTPGRSDNPLMHVEPPKREDLQPSYAQTLTGESDQGNHGWYGSMSKFAFTYHGPHS